jgi:hypothetical protein
MPTAGDERGPIFTEHGLRVADVWVRSLMANPARIFLGLHGTISEGKDVHVHVWPGTIDGASWRATADPFYSEAYSQRTLRSGFTRPWASAGSATDLIRMKELHSLPTFS